MCVNTREVFNKYFNFLCDYKIHLTLSCIVVHMCTINFENVQLPRKSR